LLSLQLAVDFTDLFFNLFFVEAVGTLMVLALSLKQDLVAILAFFLLTVVLSHALISPGKGVE